MINVNDNMKLKLTTGGVLRDHTSSNNIDDSRMQTPTTDMQRVTEDFDFRTLSLKKILIHDSFEMKCRSP